MGTRRFVTLGVGLLVGVWAVMLVVAPYFLAHDHPQGIGALAAAAMYVVGGVVCHQQPTRSFYLWDTQMPVCARCSGLYVLAPLGIVLALGSGGQRAGRGRSTEQSRANWSTRVVRMVLLVAATPTVATAGGELAGFLHPTNLARAVSAVPLGVSVVWVFGLALGGAIDESG